MIKIEEITYTNRTDTPWGIQSQIPFVSIKEEAARQNVDFAEFMAFLEKEGLRAYKFSPDFLFMVPWHFNGAVECMEYKKRKSQACITCGATPDCEKEPQHG